MTTTELLPPQTDDRLAKFRQQDAVIAKMRTDFALLKIDGVNDSRGLKLVHEARMTVKKCRVACKKLNGELKADSLKFGRACDAEFNRILALLEPIENHLQCMEDAVVIEKERIKLAAEEAKRKALQTRIDALTRLGAPVNPLVVQGWTEQQYEDALGDAQYEAERRVEIEQQAEKYRKQQAAVAEAERLRVAEVERQEREALVAERKRLDEERRKQEIEAAAERRQLEAIRREQEAEAAKLAAEKQRLQDAADAARRAAELTIARAEAAKLAAVETEQPLASEADQKRRIAEREAPEVQRREAERPHLKKLLAVADAVLAIEVPDGPGHRQVSRVLSDAEAAIRVIATGPLSEGV